MDSSMGRHLYAEEKDSRQALTGRLSAMFEDSGLSGAAGGADGTSPDKMMSSGSMSLSLCNQS